MSMTMQVSGASPRFQFQWKVASVKFADTVGPVIRDAMKAAAPVGQPQEVTGSKPLRTRQRPGTLRDSIRYQRGGTGASTEISWFAYTPYAGFVIRGTKAHEIWPKAAKYLSFGRNGQQVFVGPKGTQAHVNHPGTAPNPFNRRVMDELMDWLQETYAEIMQEALGA